MAQLMMVHMMDKVPVVPFKNGYAIRTFLPGEEMKWVEICKFGLLGEDAGIESWNSAILGMDNLFPYKDVYMVVDKNGEAVASITGFVRKDGMGDIHMVAAMEKCRGNGIGLSMLSTAMLKLKEELEPGSRIYLTTDDWRIPAIVGYLRCGFHPVEYDEGMVERWTKICNDINMHGMEMLTEDGKPTGINL